MTDDMSVPQAARSSASPTLRPRGLGGRDYVVIGAFALVILTMPMWILTIGGYEALATKIVIWGLFAVGFDIILGFTGYLSFGHAAFFGTAAYATGLSLKHLTPNILPALGISIVTAVLIGGLIGVLSLRRSGIYFSILSLAFAEMLHATALSILQKYTGGDNGLTGLPLPMLFGLQMQGIAVFYVAAVLLIIGFAVAWKIKRAPFGLLLRAIKENPLRLEYAGINIWAYKMAAFMISTVYAGIAGFLMVVYQPYVATQYVHWSTSGEVVIMSVIGGVGTLVGPILGAGFMLYFENVVQTIIGEQWRLVLGLVFVCVVIFLPGGFVALGHTIWHHLGHLVRSRRRNVLDMETDSETSGRGSARAGA
jgi:branched-chain amino acid transport system permease protein